MVLSHKIRMIPTKTQAIEFSKACGCARFTYNWGLNHWNEARKVGGTPKMNEVRKEFNRIKKDQFPWIYESPKDANQQPFSDLDTAFSRFFKGTSKYPKFKKKGQHDSFYVSNDKFTVSGKYVKLPRIGKVKLTEKLRFSGKILSGRVSRTADKWFVSISMDLGGYRKERKGNGHVGIDLGLKTFVVTSDAETFHAPKPLKKLGLKLERLSRRLSKKRKGGKNRSKARVKLARLHHRISCVRNDFLHKTSSRICGENQSMAIEDLAVGNMMKNRKLSKSISDMGFHEFRRQLEYKSKIFDNVLVVVPRFYPSSKTCSKCGCVKETLSLSERTYVCDVCGVEMDRDLNAAINLATLGFRGMNACGQEPLPKGLVETGIR